MAKKSAPAQGTAAPKEFNRVYQTDVEFDSDLYRLQSAEMLKKAPNDVSSDPKPEDLLKVPHQHFFHTYDSGGQKHDQCAAIGGHFHILTETGEVDKNGAPIYKCSGPKVVKHEKGRRKVVAAKFDDDHTHEVVYERSSKIKPRTVNLESAKVVNAEASKVAVVPGIGTAVGPRASGQAQPAE